MFSLLSIGTFIYYTYTYAPTYLDNVYILQQIQIVFNQVQFTTKLWEQNN